MIGHTRDERGFIHRKYLDGGIIRVKRGDGWELSTATLEESQGIINVTSVATGRSRLLRWEDFDVESFSFEPRLVVVNDHVALISRNGVQSTQRSLRSNDLAVQALLNSFIWERLRSERLPEKVEEQFLARATDHLEARMVHTNLPAIGKQLAQPITTTLDEAMDCLRLTKNMDVVLNKDFALSLSLSDDPRPWIWYHKLPVGKIGKGEIVVGHEDFRQELIDYLTHTNQTKGWSLRA